MPILLTAAEMQVPSLRTSPTIRLVDGPNPLTGRLQLFHKGGWRSVCTNSRKYAANITDNNGDTSDILYVNLFAVGLAQI